MGVGLAILGLIACKEKTSNPDSGVDSTPVDTEWVDTGEEVVLEEIALYPRSLRVGVGAALPLRAVGRFSDGHRELLELDLSSSDASVQTTGLLATAVSAGSSTLSVELDGVQASAELEVVADQELTLQVFADGAPLPGARVYFEGEKLVCDAQGRITLPTADGGPQSLTVFSADTAWIPVSLGGVITRDLRVELTHMSSLEPSASLLPTIDFSALDPADPDQLRLSLSGTSLGSAPVLLREEDLIRPSRQVQIFGATAELPANLGIEEHAPQVALAPSQDPTQVWTLAGTLDIAQISGGVDSFAQAAELLKAWEPTMRVDLSVPVSVSASPAIRPEDLSDQELWVTLPESVESSLVLVFDKVEAGWLLRGLASGSGLVRVPVPALDGERIVVGWQESGGAGTGAPRSMVSAQVSSGEATISAWTTPLSHAGVQPADGSYALSSDPSALYVHGFVQAKSGGVRELYLPVGDWSGSLAGDPAISLGKTQWELWSPLGWEGHYQSMLTSGGWKLAEEEAWAAGALRAEITGG